MRKTSKDDKRYGPRKTTIVREPSIMGKRMAQLRVIHNLSGRAATKKAGLHEPTWHYIESGKRPELLASSIISICKAFDISADWLLGLE